MMFKKHTKIPKNILGNTDRAVRRIRRAMVLFPHDNDLVLTIREMLISQPLRAKKLNSSYLGEFLENQKWYQWADSNRHDIAANGF